jgi:uncharacterized iron-regulated membrane protein
MLFRGVRLSVRRLHLWTGLVAGPLLLVLGLSGGVLVFGSELDDALAGGTPVVSGTGPMASLDAIAAAARTPSPGARLRALRLPEAPDRPARVQITAGREELEVLVDPRTVRVLRARAHQRSARAVVHSLHARLHAGRAGAVAVGLLGLALVGQSLMGLWLSRPWARAGRGGRAFELHRVLGVASLALNLLVAGSGVALAAAAARTPPGTAGASPPAAGPPPGLDAAAARAREASPGARVVGVVVDARGAIRVEMAPAGAYLVASGRAVAVDADEGGSRIWTLVQRLHYGDFGGWLSRALWALLGLVVSALAVTGFVVRAS